MAKYVVCTVRNGDTINIPISGYDHIVNVGDGILYIVDEQRVVLWAFARWSYFNRIDDADVR